MATPMKVKFITAGFDELRNASISSLLAGKAAAVARAAGDGFVASEVKPGRKRAHVRVYASTWQANHREAKDHALLRALDAGR